MVFRLILILPFIMSCSSKHLYMDIGEEFGPYYDTYIKEKGSGLSIKYLIIDFGETGTESIAHCKTEQHLDLLKPEIQHRITVNKNNWQLLNKYQKEIIIFHELGHCDLSLGHVQPNAIMQPNILNWVEYSNNREYYVNQLFGRQ